MSEAFAPNLSPPSPMLGPPLDTFSQKYRTRLATLHQELKQVDEKAFRARIRKLDTYTLADLRYAFGWDPKDERQSSWQARYINRELTDQNVRREQRPQWITIGISALLSLASLVISILALLKPNTGAG